MIDDRRLASAMNEAITESRRALGVSTPNPAVGAVILAPDGSEVGRGHTARAGGHHAEIAALAAAGDAARGATAVVTLEPCNHTGRTGPCAEALISAGVSRVVYAVADPTPTASGGAQRLRDAGVAVTSGVEARAAEQGPLRGWLFHQRHRRPLITVKLAATLDGRIAAPDGTSQWITGDLARARVHRERAQLDAIVVGTGTVLRDDPALTARLPDGALAGHQPMRVVMGERAVPADARIRTGAGGPVRPIATHDPARVVAELADTNWILVEGGPRIIGAFFDADLVDEVEAYLAPMILGAGHNAVAAMATSTLTDGTRFQLADVEVLGDDVVLRCVSPRLSALL